MTEEEVRKIIRDELYGSNQGQYKHVFKYLMQINDGRDIVIGKSAGTMIGTESTQKIGLYGATPIVQQAKLIQPTGGATVDNEARSAIGQLGVIFGNIGITEPYP